MTILTYLPFWKEVLNPNTKVQMDDRELDLEKKEQVVVEVTSTLINSLSICIDKLKFEIRSDQFHFTVSKNAIQLDRKDDYAVFCNIVDFYERILLVVKPETLATYLDQLLELIVNNSSCQEWNSGYYRLLAVCLKLGNSVDYFGENGKNCCNLGPAVEYDVFHYSD